MDAAELKALLQAAARELSSVASQLPKDDQHEAMLCISSDINEAREAIEQAVAACGHGPSFGTGGPPATSTVIREAAFLRTEAVRARDVAEVQLWALQDDHMAQLVRLHELSEQQRQRMDEQNVEAVSAAFKEAALVERCGKLDSEVRGLRKDVDEKSQRLLASSARGHALELKQRRLQRQHEGSLAENAVARDILALQQRTEAYLQRVSADCGAVDLSVESAQKKCADKFEGLQSKWSEQHSKYHTDMSSLEIKLADLQQEYDGRWRSTERNARQLMDNRAQHASEARQAVEQEILTLDQEWEKEALTSRQLAEQQDRMMANARQAALAEMEGRLQTRRMDMEEQVAAEHKRCEALRNRHFRKAQDCQQEVLQYKQNIEELSLGYRCKARSRPSTTSTPRGLRKPPARSSPTPTGLASYERPPGHTSPALKGMASYGPLFV